MTEVTRVPILPIAKGSMTKLWLGVALAVAAGGGLAWANRYEGIVVTTINAGDGPAPAPTDVVLVNYTGTLENGKEFDKGQQQPIPLQGTVPGFAQGLAQMKQGGKYRLEIPASLGYGAEEKRNPQTGEVVIPANSDLVFEIDLLGAMPFDQFQQMMQMQQMQQMQGGADGGAPGGPPGTPPPPLPGQPGR